MPSEQAPTPEGGEFSGERVGQGRFPSLGRGAKPVPTPHCFAGSLSQHLLTWKAGANHRLQRLAVSHILLRIGVGGGHCARQTPGYGGNRPDPPLLCEGSFATPKGERGTHLPVPYGRRDDGELASEAISMMLPLISLLGALVMEISLSLDEIFHANAFVRTVGRKDTFMEIGLAS